LALAFIHGVVLAFGLILPLGAQNVFLFNQGAAQSRFSKVVPIIITASICDTILILMAVFGVSLLVLTLSWLQTIIFGIGFIFLLYMAWSVWNSEPSTSNNEKNNLSTKKQILFALSVSLLNPHAILDTIGVIGTSSLSYVGSEKATFTIACIGVSWLWFAFLAVLGRLVGKIDTHGKYIRLLNKLSALIIFGVAIFIGKKLIELIL
jgi:L-lysine exporter family protein LysE/ArgO